MIKSILLICLAFVMVFNAAPSGVPEAASVNTEKRISRKQDDVLYQDDNVTVTLDYLLTAGTTVKAGFKVSCPENRSCIVVPNYSQALKDEDESTITNTISKIGNGETVKKCRPGEKTLCDFTWDTNETYDYSFLSKYPADDSIVQLTEASAQMTTGDFPPIAGFTLLECNGDVSSDPQFLLFGMLNDPDMPHYIVGAVSLKITSNDNGKTE